MVRPGSEVAQRLEPSLSSPLVREATFLELLRRPELKVNTLVPYVGMVLGDLDEAVADQVEVRAKYHGYIERQQLEIERIHRYDDWRLPDLMDYANVIGLSNEVREKLRLQRPETVGQASRIPGVTPAAVSLLLVHLRKRGA